MYSEVLRTSNSNCRQPLHVGRFRRSLFFLTGRGFCRPPSSVRESTHTGRLQPPAPGSSNHALLALESAWPSGNGSSRCSTGRKRSEPKSRATDPAFQLTLDRPRALLQPQQPMLANRAAPAAVVPTTSRQSANRFGDGLELFRLCQQPRRAHRRPRLLKRHFIRIHDAPIASLQNCSWRAPPHQMFSGFLAATSTTRRWSRTPAMIENSNGIESLSH